MREKTAWVGTTTQRNRVSVRHLYKGTGRSLHRSAWHFVLGRIERREMIMKCGILKPEI